MINAAPGSLNVSRRRLLEFVLGGSAASVLALPASARSAPRTRAGSSEDVPSGFPAQNPELVQRVVGRSHFDLDAVRELLADQPELAKASWDWGFGDWESALGAASHTGRREIAELLIAHGARPDLFTYAMLGRIDAVRAMIAAQPGVQRIPGPHGITLLAHARFGGDESRDVLAYLEELGDADPRPKDEPIDEATHQACLGTYAFASIERDEPIAVPNIEVTTMRTGALGLTVGAGFARGLHHQGGLVFHPAGAPSALIAFARTGSAPCGAVTIQVGGTQLRWARR